VVRTADVLEVPGFLEVPPDQGYIALIVELMPDGDHLRRGTAVLYFLIRQPPKLAFRLTLTEDSRDVELSLS
jgi:hypothetical protein